jgi:LytS/YehU family sensor histidine kinase
MLEDLIAYLRAALPHLRESASTVRQELALARAWLEIMRRSVAGLDVSLVAAPEVEDARVPALVMLPLVQQALAGADREGIHLALSVGRHDDRLRVCIETSTRGFDTTCAEAIAPIEERLRALYGGEASSTTGLMPAGSRAVLELPLDTAPEAAARAAA